MSTSETNNHVTFFEPMMMSPVAIGHQKLTPEEIKSTVEILESNGLPLYIETDVITNRSGTPLVAHGANTPLSKIRTPHIPTQLRFRLMSDKGLENYNKRHPHEQISTLEEILEGFPRVRFILHLKNNQPEAIAKVLERTNSFANVCAGAMRGSTLKDLSATLSKMEKKIAMFISLSDSAIMSAKMYASHISNNLAIAREHWNSLGYPTAWNALPQITPNQVGLLRKILEIPVIATETFTRKPQTTKRFANQYSKGLNGLIADDIESLALAAVKSRC
ncbi:MAG: hypothetical protein LBQ11_02300 [Candidatus Nomurabacteria bacterium]|nr:hypothetical protein [Candidatus Nomurabacteria bacterium]